MTLQPIAISRLAATAAAACALLLGACASAPPNAGAAPTRAEVTNEPVTGSNIPRRDRKGVSNVTVSGPEALKEVTNKSAPPPSN